ncbi:MAG: DUF624 domain-containing protein [Anaerolineae bacterium]|nr:DUF624 domain-containing protein [Anaerolineae bacterium]
MWDGLRVFWHSLSQSAARGGYVYVWANLAWVLWSLPLVTLPASTAALMRVMYDLQTGPTCQFEGFTDAFRRYFWRATALGALTVGVVGIAAHNWHAYRDETGLFVDLLRGVWAAAVVIWTGMLLYVWPLLFEQEDQRLVTGLRNALVMAVSNPGFTFALLIAAALIGVVSTVLVFPWIFITASWMAALSSTAVLDRLARYRRSMHGDA